MSLAQHVLNSMKISMNEMNKTICMKHRRETAEDNLP